MAQPTCGGFFIACFYQLWEPCYGSALKQRYNRFLYFGWGAN